VKATWIAALVQWNLAAMGFTKSVHPYCRLAIITMPIMPMTSWTHRLVSPLAREDDIEPADITHPPP